MRIVSKFILNSNIIFIERIIEIKRNNQHLLDKLLHISRGKTS